MLGAGRRALWMQRAAGRGASQGWRALSRSAGLKRGHDSEASARHAHDDADSKDQLANEASALFLGIAQAFKSFPETKALKKPIMQRAEEAKAPPIKTVEELQKMMKRLFASRDYQSCVNLFVRNTGQEGSLKPDRTCYLFAIAACGKIGYSLLATRLLDEMEAEVMDISTTAYNAALASCEERGNLAQSFDIFERMKAMDQEPSIDTYNRMIRTLVLQESIESAQALLSEMELNHISPDEGSYTTLIEGHLQAGDMVSAASLLSNLEKQTGGDVSPRVYLSYLWALARQDLHQEIEQYLDKFEESRLKKEANSEVTMTLGLYEELLRAAARGGAVDVASKLWDRMHRDFKGLRPSADAYCNMINVNAAAGFYDKAFDLLSKSRDEGLTLDVEDLSPSVNAMAQSAEEVDRAYYKLVERKDEAKRISITELNLILAACARLGDSVRTRQTFDEIESTFHLRPNVTSFNMLFRMAELTDEVSRVSGLILDMKSASVRPDAMTFQILTRSLVKNRKTKDAVAMLEKGLGAGVRPTFATIVLLTRLIRVRARGFAANELPRSFVDMRNRIMALRQRFQYPSISIPQGSAREESNRRRALYRSDSRSSEDWLQNSWRRPPLQGKKRRKQSSLKNANASRRTPVDGASGDTSRTEEIAESNVASSTGEQLLGAEVDREEVDGGKSGGQAPKEGRRATAAGRSGKKSGSKKMKDASDVEPEESASAAEDAPTGNHEDVTTAGANVGEDAEDSSPRKSRKAAEATRATTSTKDARGAKATKGAKTASSKEDTEGPKTTEATKDAKAASSKEDTEGPKTTKATKTKRSASKTGASKRAAGSSAEPPSSSPDEDSSNQTVRDAAV